MDRSYIKRLSSSVRDNWDLPAFSDYRGTTYSYADFAARMARVHLLLEAAGVERGSKVAIIGRNSSGWAMDFFGILSYGCIAVPILHDFKPSSIHHIVNHCEAKALFVANSVWENVDVSQMEELRIVMRIDNLRVLFMKQDGPVDESLGDTLFKEKFAEHFRFEDLEFHEDQPDELALISYTSGTSGFSKGVMIPYRAIWSNMQFVADNIRVLKPGTDVISILPMAHMYGLAFEIYTEVCLGVHIHFLTRNPSPNIILETFQKFSPVFIVAVPMVLEKIIKKNVFPLIEKKTFKFLLHLPLIKQRIYNTINEQLKKVLGNNFYEVIVGGAAFNPDVEHFLKQIHFPYTVGYGMTECAPLISYAGHETFAEGSVGRAVDRMEIRIDSSDPQNVIGEIQTRGDNVMLGYFKDKLATKNVFTADGWLRTGDLGTIDADGNLFIRGRSKNMILGPSGQNIYPEEIEGLLNAQPYVGESLIVSRNNKLLALIHPDLDLMDSEGVSTENITTMMEQNLVSLNETLPSYCQVSTFQIFQDEFEKTPKRSIKRYLYK